MARGKKNNIAELKKNEDVKKEAVVEEKNTTPEEVIEEKSIEENVVENPEEKEEKEIVEEKHIEDSKEGEVNQEKKEEKNENELVKVKFILPHNGTITLDFGGGMVRRIKYGDVIQIERKHYEKFKRYFLPVK